MHLAAFLTIGLIYLIVSTSSQAQPEPAVLVGAGDIARCSESNMAKETAKLLDRIPGTVFTAGDNAYPSGTLRDYAECYHASWGRHRARTRPTLGNHDYKTPDAAPYFQYFSDTAGPAGKGYYSYKLGAWHIVSLNSNLAAKSWGPAQEKWLRGNLGAISTECVLAYWHHPRFSSVTGGRSGGNVYLSSLFQVLYKHGVSVLLSGHDHIYERFAPQDPDGALAANGIRQFVVGTGGDSFYKIRSVTRNSEVRSENSYGVLKLTLRAKSYDWEFVPIAGHTFRDTGTSSCSARISSRSGKM